MSPPGRESPRKRAEEEPAWVSPFDSETLGELVRRRADLHGDKRAFYGLDGPGAEGDSEEMTYGELDTRARSLAAGLATASCRLGDRVLVVLPPSLDLIAAFYGVLCAGAVAVLAPPGRRGRARRSLQEILRRARPALLLHRQEEPVEELLAGAGVKDCRAVTLESLEGSPAAAWRRPPVKAGSPALIQFTSGSTSRPRGTVVTHGNLLHNSRQIHRCFHHTSKSRGLLWLPPYHDMGLIGGLVQPLYAGFECGFLPPMTIARRPLDWLRAISEQGATTSGAPDFAYALCVREFRPEAMEGVSLKRWEVAFTGAEPIRPATLRSFARTFAPYGFRLRAFLACYGLAESTLLVSAGRKRTRPLRLWLDAEALDHQGEARRGRHLERRRLAVGCGRPAADTRVVIADAESRRALAPGRVGEIWIAGPGVAAGYFRDPEATRRTFDAYLDTGEGPFLRTGDLGFLRKGHLFVTGRLKDLIIVRGVNHHPEDLEETAQGASEALAPGRCAAFADDRGEGERPVLALEVTRSALRDGEPLEEVVEAVRRRVAEVHQLSLGAVVLLRPGGLPRTATGKVRRRACRDAYYGGELREVFRWQGKEPGEEAGPSHGPPAKGVDRPRIPEPEDLDGAELREVIVLWLEDKLRRELNVPAHKLRHDSHLAAYGLDSMTATKLAAELAHWLGEPVEPILLWDYPNVAALSTYLSERRRSPERIRSRFEVPGGADP